MKLLFSEAKPDYAHYVFPFAVWAFPEEGETPADLFNHGFLPSSPNLDRYYMCRHVRVTLERFEQSSENRRILRKGAGIEFTLVPREKFDYTPEKRGFFKRYADARFGADVMSDARLDRLFSSKIVSHILTFTDSVTKQDVGFVTLYLDRPRIGYYYYAFYDLDYSSRNLGLYMMTSAVAFLAESGVEHLYLGTCYSANAQYKTQFAGAEFFNGMRWSHDLKELRHMIDRQQTNAPEHLWESPDFRDKFYPQPTEQLAGMTLFQMKIEKPGAS
jgi:arginyl-tRNA--protein-N-Asp/Glu arginylyltransferase